VIEGPAPGGQLINTTEVENFPGYPNGVTGPKLMEDLRAQAQRFDADLRSGLVTAVDLLERPFKVIVDGTNTITASTVIIATGATARYLGLPDEQKYMGMGVSACATCDGFFYRNRTVAVVGGGDTACEEALYLAGIAEKVYLIVRKSYLRASKVMQQRVLDNPKIQILFNTNTVGLTGQDVVEGANLVENVGTEQEHHFEIKIDGFFLAIGHSPRTELFAGAIDLDEGGFIKVKGNSTATNIPGVFAAGDVADHVYQQAVVAAASGCRAALDAEKFLLEH
jgi:thioredoxin reductase (NADPH)